MFVQVEISNHQQTLRTSRTPAYLVFAEQEIDLEYCYQQFEKISTNEKQIIIIYDEKYSKSMMDLEKMAKKDNKTWMFGHIAEKILDPSQNIQPDANQTILFGRNLPKNNIENSTFVFVGTECTTLTNWIMNFPKNKVNPPIIKLTKKTYSFNPETKETRIESAQVNKHLMRRYYLVEKAKDAMTIGILVGTLGVGNI